jgi:hypothetical protein
MSKRPDLIWRPLAVALVVACCLTSAHAQGMRPEVGKPLQQASDLLKAGKAKEALAKVREAEAVGGKSANEQITVDRMKAAAAQRAGDVGTAIQALESLFDRVGGAEKGQVAEQIANSYAQQRSNAKANEWVAKAVQAGNNGGGIRQLQSYLQSAGGDYAAIARDAQAAVSGAEQAGRRPGEDDLLRLADAQQRLGNMGAYGNTLEKLLLNYPKKDYWNAYLGRLPRKAGFSGRYELDVMRLRLASGTLTKTEEYMEMAQLALQAGLPAEGRRIAEQGYKLGVLGTGAEAARHQRLRDLAVKQEESVKAGLAARATEAATEPEGDALVNIGYAFVSLGDVDQGIKLIEQGIAKGKLKRPDEARLRLGMAQLQSSSAKSKATATLRSVKGTDGTAEIARLWLVLGNS